MHKTLVSAGDWAIHDYLPALAAGNSLSHADKSAIAQTLSRYTSLSPDYIMKANLRVSPGEFRKMLLANSQQLIGRFDTRITGFDPDPLSRSAEYDPSLDPYFAAYSGTFNDYVRRTLKVDDEHPYEVLSSQVGPWDFGDHGQGYLDVSDRLRDAMLSNTHMKVMFANGYFDLATPYLAADYTIDHMNLSPQLCAQHFPRVLLQRPHGLSAKGGPGEVIEGRAAFHRVGVTGPGDGRDAAVITEAAVIRPVPSRRRGGCRG